MTPTEYLRVFVRFWWLVVLCTALGTGLSFLVDAVATPTYTATANVYVSGVRTGATTPADAVQGTVLAQQRVGSYADIARGESLAQGIIGELGLTLTPAELQRRTDITVPPQTSLVRISVDDTDPERAQSIAAATASAITTTVTDLEGSRGQGKPQLRARVVGDSEVPTAPTAPPAWRNPVLGGAGGLAAGLGLAVVLSRLDRRIRDASTAREVFDAPVLAVLAVLPRPGRGRRPRSRDRWDQSVRELRTGVFFLRPDPGRCLTLALVPPHPTPGITEMAGDLAAALVDAGCRVLLVEADLHGPQPAPLPPTSTDDPAGPSVGLSDYLSSACAADDVVRHHERTGVDLVPAGAVPDSPADLLHGELLATLLQDSARRYDFVLVTTAPTTAGTDAAAVAARCDGALVVTTARTTTRARARSCLAHLRRVDAPVLGAVLLS